MAYNLTVGWLDCLRRTRRPEVRASSQGICFGERLVRWASVARVEAFKFDLLTFDEVCVDLFGRDGQVLGRVWEDDPAFEAVVAWIETLVPRFSDWRNYVIYPPFAERRVTVWPVDGNDERDDA